MSASVMVSFESSIHMVLNGLPGTGTGPSSYHTLPILVSFVAVFKALHI